MKTLEEQVHQQIIDGLGKAIETRLTQSYGDTALNKLIDSVIVTKLPEIRKLIEEAMDGALGGDFRAALKDALTHKLARIITSKMEGEIEKRANELRASPETRARITLAIESCLKSIN